MRRAPGTGSITKVRTGYWAQLWENGARKSYGVHATEQEADDVLHLAIATRTERGGSAGSKQTFAEYGKQVLEARESQVAGSRQEKAVFKKHLEGSTIGPMLLGNITTAHIGQLCDRLTNGKADDRRGSRHRKSRTVIRTLTVARAIFKEAKREGLILTNPCDGVSVKKLKVERNQGQLWDVLKGPEQAKILACPDIPAWGKAIVQFAWGTGLRQGEHWRLELRDLHLDGCDGCAPGLPANPDPHLYVRAAKNGCPRVVPLFSHGLVAARAQLRLLPKRNPLGLVFPTAQGERRQIGGPKKSVYENGKQRSLYLLPEWLKMAGVKRKLRWHDLRHTCGSSLVNGVWGPAWPLLEVKAMLGHSSVKVTEMYAHTARETLANMARLTGEAYAKLMEPPGS